MLDFKEPKITDKPWVDQCLSHAHSMNCEYTFGNIFVWRTAYVTRICHYKDFLLTPFSIIFSRGRSSAAHRLIVSFFIFFSLPAASTCSLLFIEILLECLELIFAAYATVPPGTPETGSVSDELDEGGGNGIDADAQALVP